MYRVREQDLPFKVSSYNFVEPLVQLDVHLSPRFIQENLS
jgi:hypothetical protein